MGSTTNIVPRACRNCRIRKIRCSREIPCTNCITSKITCQESTKDVTRRSTHARSVPERDQDSIESLRKRVTALEQQLNSLSSDRNTQVSEAATTSTVLSPTLAQLTPQPSPCHIDLASLEGDSSFRKQALLATDITEFGSLAGIGSPQVVDKISGLRKLLERKASDGDTPQCREWKPSTSITLQGNLPPADFVIRLLRAVQVGELTLLNAMLAVILCTLECFPRPEFSEEEVAKYLVVCKENQLTGIETYEVNMVSTFEHCLVLCMAAQKAQTEGDIALQWRLSSTAARHCLVLGYHREHVVAAMPPDEADRVRRLFWSIYFSDKSTVLSLGRTSTIQDLDVDLDPYAISSDPGRESWDTSLWMFIDYARIQASIYENLYSPASRRRSTADRQIIVDETTKQLSNWHESWNQLDTSKAYNKKLFDNTFGPVDVSYYSTLTLVHHAPDLSTSVRIISDPCLEAAKSGLQSHVSVHAQYSLLEPQSLAFFAVWVHVYCPLTPFVVIFLHCITNSDTGDLDLLKGSLDVMAQTSSLARSCERPYEFCKYLYSIAEAHISACTENGGEADEKVDLGLASLQHPPSENWPFPDLNLQLISSAFPSSDWWAPHTS
ncbi:Zn(2)-C6 fungal-type domain-containing protein [Fusarium keratoplasticum]|nr:Zn(2)-C6 fungal-type domain-containing protein [Fusarium keratoplasticum]